MFATSFDLMVYVMFALRYPVLPYFLFACVQDAAVAQPAEHDSGVAAME